MNHFLDYFFLTFHTLLIFFNLFGWAWMKTRRLNLVTLLLTGASWFILGIYYGIGYCPLTEWHWQVLEKLGKQHLPDSYVAYLADRVAGIVISSGTADLLTAVLYFAALGISLILNIHGWKGKR